MARSRNGRLLGRAGAEEKRDVLAWLRSEEQKQAEAERLKREAERIEEEQDLIRKCIALEGEPSFWRWWDDDEQVPPYGKRSERIALLRERLSRHEASVAGTAGGG